MAEHEYQVIDESFVFCVNMSARVERLFTGCIWAEGPAYFPAHRSLVWSDIPNNRMMRWDETTGETGVFRQSADYTNGNTIDCEGRLVSCQHGMRRVIRTEHDGSVTVIADQYNGMRLNSPNDVVVKSDGTIWFTDPSYGIDSNFEGFKSESEIGSDNVYRVDPHSGGIEIVADDFRRPNGLAFSVDEKRLYIVDSGGIRYPDNRKHIRVFDVSSDSTLSGGEVFAECSNGKFDGLRLDDAGRVWSSAADGVHCFSSDGALLGKILVPEEVSNLCFGGPRNNRLFITATSSVYSVLLPVDGAPQCWMSNAA